MRRIQPCLSILLTTCALVLNAGCPVRPPDDALEPNDAPLDATPIFFGQSVSARAVQNNPDVFIVNVLPASGSPTSQILEFMIESHGGEDCPSFVVNAPDDSLLYQDTNYYCSRAFSPPVTADGASLTIQPGVSYTIRVPAATPGNYLLTVNERGQVDNFFDYAWDYQVTVRLTN